jgi:hypothetical protein
MPNARLDAERRGPVTGALLAFLWFNAHPAEVFMGDLMRVERIGLQRLARLPVWTRVRSCYGFSGATKKGAPPRGGLERVRTVRP